MITTIRTEDNQLLLEYDYYDYKRRKFYTRQRYSIECLSNDDVNTQYDDLGTAKNEVYRCIESKDFYRYHIRELLATFPNHNEFKNVEMTIYINGAEVLLNISSNIISYFTDLNINNRNNNLDAYVIRNVQLAEHVNAISHTNIIGCVEGQKISLANGKYSVGILLYKALLFVEYNN